MTTESMRADDLRMDLGTLLGAVFSRWFRIILVTLLLLGITYGILLFVPRMYESQAGVLVETRENAFTSPATGNPQSAASSTTVDAAISSQIELIKSRDTLLLVIDKLNLRSAPEFNGSGASPLGFVMQLIGRKPETRSVDESVLENLNERLTVIRERDSAIISIFVRSADPQLAADAANAIADAHVKRRADLSLEDTAEASVWLEQEIVKLRERVTEAETRVANYRVENDLFAGPNNTTLLEQQLVNLTTQINQAQERRNTAQSRATLIRNLLESGRPLDGVPDVQASVVIQQLSQTKATLQGELAQREATLLPNHPTVRALVAQIAEIEQQISAEARRVASALEAEASIEADLETSLQDELTRLKLTASSAATSTVQLDELQREAKAQRDLLESYLLRYRDAIARSDSSSALPDVRVVTLAAPSVTPASPKVSLILGAVALVALALQVGGIIFGELMSGRALVERRVTDDGDVIYEEIEEEIPVDAEDEMAVVVEEVPAPAPVAAPPPPAPAAARPPSAAPIPVQIMRVGAPEPKPAAPPTPPPEPPPVSAAPAPSAPSVQPTHEVCAQKSLELSNISADLALGRARIVMLAGLTGHRDCEAVAERLVTDALRNGLSIVRVDAGSGRESTDPGITDLAAERASFGDVVHKSGRDGLAEVPWGHQASLDRRSIKPLTLIEALTDIYESVIVMTGRVGMTSALPLFAGTDCRLVIVGREPATPDLVEAALADAAALGYQPVQFVAASQLHAEVA